MRSAPTPLETRNHLASAAQAIVQRLVADPTRRAEQLGEVFLACEEAARQCPRDFREALGAGELEAFLLPRVRATLRPERTESAHGGWLGTFVDPHGRAIESDEPDTTNPQALATSRRALQRAVSIAAAEGNETLLRNLRWYQERLAHKSYDSIARAENRVPATIRTGVARARKFVLRVVHELQHAQPAPLSGEAPGELAPLRQLWFEQDLESLGRELERTREQWSDNPHWLNLAALLAADRGHHDEALGLYERALVFADAAPVRGRVLNNLGNLAQDQGRLDAAQQYWLRASQLVPAAPAPLLNLLSGASLSKDYASAQHYIAELSNLLNSGRLSAEERAYVVRRLDQNPKLAWLRETDAWSLGPARWIRASRVNGRHPARALTATAVLLLAGLLSFLPWSAPRSHAVASSVAPVRVAYTSAAPTPFIPAAQRGGDSMGGPVKRSEAVEPAPGLHAGDSMGRSGEPRPAPGRPIGRSTA